MIVGLVLSLLIPIVYMVIGLLFWLRPPKLINGVMGYRTARAMKSQEAWEFANRLSGKLLLILGIVFVIISLIAGLITMNLSDDIFGIYIISLVMIQTIAIAFVIVRTEKALKRFD